MSYEDYSLVNIGVATTFLGVGSYLVGGTKEDDPNRKLLKGFGIFFIIVGSLISVWELVKYGAYRAELANMNGGAAANPMYEVPQSAVVEAPPNTGVVNNAPSGTVIVNNSAPNNMGVGRRNNGRTN